ncbi:hypothetical protein [uncultured Sphaerochaeta sp.]|uniref:hypothetical protein n=1 Tax=uncultured Sphaerochaeta sp. TaxID=886478 RepID=UPI0026133ED7|nr:hypothetical protein [uncultured Sphaerochaeta sp.]
MKRRTPCALIINEESITADFGPLGTIEDRLLSRGNLLVLTRNWNLRQQGSYRLQAAFSYDDQELENKLFIPALWYQDNNKGKGCFPSRERSANWSFLETRMSIPCCAQLSNGKRLFTCASKPATDKMFVASVAPDRHGLIISIPGSEWPYSYQGKQSLVDTSSLALPCLEVSSQGLAYTRTFYLSNQKAGSSLEGYCQFVQGLNALSPEDKVEGIGWDHWFEYKLTRLINLVQNDGKGLAYLLMGEGNGEVQDVYKFTSASFLVKSLQGAQELASLTKYQPKTNALVTARANLATKFSLPDNHLLLAEVAKRIGDFFLQAERSEGVFQDNYDLVNDIWGGYLGIGEHPEYKSMVNSRCNGEAMKQYVLLARTLQKLEREEISYLSLARRVARFYCEAQLSSGSFGRWWTEKGKPGDIQGTNGAYIGSFFCTIIPLLSDEDPLKADLLSAVHQAYSFYSELAYEGEFYGDTLDADSCDKEAGVALLSFFLDLYDLEHDKRLLESAKLAAQFIVQWIWQFDSYLPRESMLGQRNFRTRGMTSVSVAHHHLDFYGMAIAYEFLRYAAWTGEVFYQQQAKLMIEACRQLVATETDQLGRDETYIGWQPEQLNHTTWEYFNRTHAMQGYYDIDIAWVTVLTLGSYQLILEKFPSMLEE